MDENTLLELLRQLFATYGASQPINTGLLPLNVFVNVVQWSAIILSALVGVYEARRRELDFTGALVVACAVSFGGGTLRDMMLGRTPLFWITSPIYFVTVLIVALFGHFVVSHGERARGLTAAVISPVWNVLRSDHMPFWLIALDALALGLWAYLGASIALTHGSAWLVAPVLGVMTASFGGVLRDIFFAQVPTVFKRGQLYAICAFWGSVAYVAVYALTREVVAAFVLCVLVTFLMRMAAVKFNIVT